MNTVLLKVIPIGSHTAEFLANIIKGVLDEWGLSNQYLLPLEQRIIQKFVTDTTAVMPAMVRILGFMWIPCAAHIFTKSPTAMNELKRAQNNYSVKEVKLLQDVPTRWNSTIFNNGAPEPTNEYSRKIRKRQMSAQEWEISQ